MCAVRISSNCGIRGPIEGEMKHSVRRVGGMTEETVAYLNKVSQDHISMGLQHGERHKQYKLGAIVVRPQYFPETEDVFKWKLPLEGDEDPALNHTKRRAQFS